MVFLIAYALFEVPSNYFLKKLKPSVRLPSTLPTSNLTPATEMDRFLDAVMGSSDNGARWGTQLCTSNRPSLSAWRYIHKPYPPELRKYTP